jgi:hypothetical protein
VLGQFKRLFAHRAFGVGLFAQRQPGGEFGGGLQRQAAERG